MELPRGIERHSVFVNLIKKRDKEILFIITIIIFYHNETTCI